MNTTPTLPPRRRWPPMLALLMILSAVLACNLTSDNSPPTIVPAATSTPPPTIGYATLRPDELPAVATYIAPPGGGQAIAMAPTSSGLSGAPIGPRTDTALLNLLNQMQAERLMAHVTALTNMGTRHLASGSLSGGGVNGAHDYLVQQFDAIGQLSDNRFARLESQAFTTGFTDQDITARNVIGVISGYEPGAGVLLIGAHYDSISADWENPAANAPGSNDNASGVAALIEIARIMSQRPHRMTVMFVAFGAEEIGRKGSLALVNDYLLPNGIRVDYMLNMDIIGSSTGANGAVDDRRIRLYSAEPNESAARQMSRSISLVVSQHVPGMEAVVMPTLDREGRYSDHQSFSDVGFPAVRFIEMLEDPNRNHTDRDNLDTIRPTYLTNAAKVVLAAATSLADGARPPDGVSLRADGGGLRTLLWNPAKDAVNYIVAMRRPDSLIYDQFFETPTNSVQWDGFNASEWVGLAVASKDASGLIGPFSSEYAIGS